MHIRTISVEILHIMKQRKRKVEYDVLKISDASGVGVESVRRAIREGELDFEDLLSVSRYVVGCRLRGGKE